jgi:hypothetical protein
MKKRKNNTGHYRKLPSGSYELSISLGFDKNGKRHRKYKIVYVESDEEAEIELKKFAQENIINCVNPRTKFYTKKRNTI